MTCYVFKSDEFLLTDSMSTKIFISINKLTLKNFISKTRLGTPEPYRIHQAHCEPFNSSLVIEPLPYCY